MKSWKIIYGSYDGIQKEAVKRLYAIVSKHTGKLSCCLAGKVDEKDLNDFNIIFVGTKKNNKFLNEYSFEEKVEGYYIKVEKSKYNQENQVVVISGADDMGVLYGCVDFENKYLANAKNNHIHTDYFKKLFVDELPETEFASAPAVSDRGLWTWGYVIYDYKKYIDNMVALKLNIVTIWNDYPPVNAKEIVEYAHRFGVKVVWGFSWLWDTNCNAIDISDLDNQVQTVVDTYENDYASLGGDGIYFQSFTETDKEDNGGMVIAQAVTYFVNKVSGELYKKYPDINLQFGLHATSVKNKLEYLKELNPKITIVWEDCGAFPYHYIPQKIDGIPETAELTDKIMAVNNNPGKFGVVLKGLTCLDWTTFVHQEGEFVLGEYGTAFINNRTEEKKELWKYVQAYWLRNADVALDTIKQMTDGRNGNLVISALVEDGMFDKNIWYPIALYAEMLWSVDKDIKDIMCDVALIPEVVFA